MLAVPAIRVTPCNSAPVGRVGRYVLYWMIAQRRTTWNFALQRAVEWASQLGKPVLVFEALRVAYPWASDRLHRFILQGMADNARRLAARRVTYYPYVEPEPGAGSGLLESLAEQAAVVVTDEFPSFFLPHMVARVAPRLPVLLEQVDSNGLLPLRASERAYPTAFSFRRHLQKTLPKYLNEFPLPDPLSATDLPPARRVPRAIQERWPPASKRLLRAQPEALAELPIDHSLGAAAFDGGTTAAEATWRHFLRHQLHDYLQSRNHPDDEGASGLSPYFHFGHISSHQVFDELMQQDDWSVDRLPRKASGSREGWWHASPPVEAFLDQFVTWRELGYNMCHWREDYDRYESLPDWARQTLEKHARDKRPHLYSLEELAEGRTADRLWNAAQTQLVRDGRLHNYMRMLWGKRILEWTPSPRDALEVLIELNNRYAVDGRDPNSYSGIFWVLGRYDRAWGPERPIFGKVRYLSSANTERKLRVAKYLDRYAPREAAT